MDINNIKIICVSLLIVIFLSVIIYFFYCIDMRKEYSPEDIRYKATQNNGIIRFVFKYFFWQKNKKDFIEKKYSKEIYHDGRLYMVILAYRNKTVFNTKDFIDILIYRYFIIDTQLKREGDILNNVIGNNNVIGDNNIVNIKYNEQYFKILENLEKIKENKNINDMNKQSIELFKLKLESNNVNDIDKNRVIETLKEISPYVSLAAATINLIKSLL